MAQKITRVLSCEATQGFGTIPEGKTNRNLVVTCSFGATASKFSVTGEKSIYTANMTISEDDWLKSDKDKEACVKRFAKDLQEALASEEFVLYGHLFTVSELTDGEHNSVYNKTTRHTIETFAQALETDDSDNARTFLSRALRRQIENKKFLWEKPE